MIPVLQKISMGEVLEVTIWCEYGNTTLGTTYIDAQSCPHWQYKMDFPSAGYSW